MTVGQDTRDLDERAGCRSAALKSSVHRQGQKLALCPFSKTKESHGRAAGDGELHRAGGPENES